MKIISKFSDYYDSVQAYGVDKKILYKRFTKHLEPSSVKHNHLLRISIIEEILFNDNWRTWPVLRKTKIGLHISHFILVFFCGKIHPCLVWKKETKNNKISYYFCYTIQDNENIVMSYGSKKQKKQWSPKYKTNSFDLYDYIEISKMWFKIDQLQNYNAITDLHHYLGVPVFTYYEDYRKNIFIINPKLSQIQFYKTKPIYQAYQEISMFISGVLGGQSPPMIEISDKDRKSMHGFDKWSFKKHKKERK